MTASPLLIIDNMSQFSALVLVGLCGAAAAQTPTANPMPDGSHDMYVGLGAVAAPRWDGAASHRTRARHALQLEWSNGLFVSGMSAGMHLSDRPDVEFGPLLALVPGRTEAGTGSALGSVVPDEGSTLTTHTSFPSKTQPGRLTGLTDIGTRLSAGMFWNVYPAPGLRLATSVLYGSGRDHRGARATLDLQHLATEVAPHHSVSAGVGVTLANREDTASYFGVTDAEAATSSWPAYAPGGGWRDLHAGLRWTWRVSPQWLLTSTVAVARLRADAARSPLVERPTNTSVSTALAYRF
jgi:outer membrane scaffolding protein for murein synthesis (MipA/OmpV family)